MPVNPEELKTSTGFKCGECGTTTAVHAPGFSEGKREAEVWVMTQDEGVDRPGPPRAPVPEPRKKGFFAVIAQTTCNRVDGVETTVTTFTPQKGGDL